MAEELLGGNRRGPATLEEKRKLRDLCKRLPVVTNEELREMQYIEWGLTLSEYNILKFGE